MLYGKEHVERYVATNGEEGHDWQGTTTLILTTVGRKSGQRRSTPLIYRTDGDAFVVVASKGGDPDHPLWYKNLLANPEAEIQVKADRYRVRARTADEEEKARLWPRMAATWPQYDEYQTKTERSIPVVVLDPVEKLA
ncbi:nitroreductase family deazaflavin-dependent oxidoreductase [Streptomonospora sp. S1-112]|uniref:Nitroreductase family deazaflavin-dependent oxidoreductase n=1 Tax=Streptomonospora mangrovi TaxID=2883123 RepID=A0A9X3SR02_9ACTN|nr:nitroreductase family deazaflavin-dependent oxidoreductase [Streptomonospora mangrovi]MDA0566966.1 nitroreductase family deazaflavin-dependent oxidoreductase [Streptomonospora mangrovi]